MFSHIVIFWTDPAETNATEEVVASAKKYLASIPGVMNFHAGKMARSHRGVVDQSYQVALNLQFETKQAQDEYQDHPPAFGVCGKVQAALDEGSRLRFRVRPLTASSTARSSKHEEIQLPFSSPGTLSRTMSPTMARISD